MSEDRDPLDDLLDRALAAHGRGEPRPGLEGRVLANLEARPPLPWWRALLAGRAAWAGVAAGALAVVVVAFVVVPRSRREETVVPAAAAIPAPTVAAPPEVPSADVAPVGLPAPAEAVARLAPTSRRTVALTARRASFPHRSPLSEQEVLLLRYVSEAPREEVEMSAGFLDAPAVLPPLPDPTTNS